MKFNVELKGGLGNQMFQYAFAKSLSEHFHGELYIDTSKLFNSGIKRKYMLQHMFGIQELIDTNFVYNRKIEELNPYTFECEKNYYNHLENDSYHVVGYWQNENYFKIYESKIREIYQQKKISLNENSLLLQVRRTDFVSNHSHEYCNLDWYKKALTYFNDYSLYITSDDLDWCYTNFKEHNPIFLDGDLKNQFEIMVNCENFIISNSSFGWWGAWLSESKKVVCPKIWFPGDLRWNTAKKEWIKI